MWINCIIGQFKPYLIIALACCAVTNCVSLFLFCNIHLCLGNKRPGNGSPKHISSFIHSACPQHRKYKVSDKFLFKVCYINLTRSCLYSLFLKRRKLFSLPQLC